MKKPLARLIVIETMGLSESWRAVFSRDMSRVRKYDPAAHPRRPNLKQNILIPIALVKLLR